MTKENRQFISLDEVAALHFECTDEGCRARATVPSLAWDKLPRKCPSCGLEWWAEKTHKDSESSENTINALQKSILRLVDIAKNQKDLKGNSYLGCKISLEIKGEDNAEGKQAR
jgi:hypothetical protein